MSREQAFREDAPLHEALARELRFQALRLRVQTFAKSREPACSAQEAEALDWVEALAASGHVGAQRAVLRVTQRPAALEQVHAAMPGRLEAWVGRYAGVADFLVRFECRKPQPDLTMLQRYLEQSPQLRRYASDVGELRAVAPGPVAAGDLTVLRKYFGDSGGLPYELVELLGRGEREGFLYELAKWRLGATEPSVRRVGRTLLESGARQGLSMARERLRRDAEKD